MQEPMLTELCEKLSANIQEMVYASLKLHEPQAPGEDSFNKMADLEGETLKIITAAATRGVNLAAMTFAANVKRGYFPEDFLQIGGNPRANSEELTRTLVDTNILTRLASISSLAPFVYPVQLQLDSIGGSDARVYCYEVGDLSKLLNEIRACITNELPLVTSVKVKTALYESLQWDDDSYTIEEDAAAGLMQGLNRLSDEELKAVFEGTTANA